VNCSAQSVPLRVCLIVGGATSHEELSSLLSAFQDDEEFSIVSILRHTLKQQRASAKGSAPRTSSRQQLTTVRQITFNALRILESLFLRGSKNPTRWQQTRGRAGPQTDICAEWDAEARTLIYQESEILKLHRLETDLAVCASDLRLGASLIDQFPVGVFQAQHGNLSCPRIGPPGFDEVVLGEDETKVRIARLQSGRLRGSACEEGIFPTAPTFSQNYLIALDYSAGLLRRVLSNLGTKKYAASGLPESAPTNYVGVVVTLLQQTRYVMVLGLRFFRHIIHRRGKWGVSYQFLSNWRTMDLSRSVIIKNPPGRYLADPFLFFHKGRHYCFVEDFDIRTHRGRISVLEISPNACTGPSVAIQEEFHMSYPFIFKDGNSIYMCPETHQAREIRLYKCLVFPHSWALAEVLIRGVSAVDTNIFFSSGRWWIMTNLAITPKSSHASELHLYSSKKLEGGTWEPHPLNPVKSGPRCARNGGLFAENDYIFRVFQVQRFGIYGHHFGVARVETINTSEYSESLELEVDPDFFRKNRGSHSFSYTRGLLAVDFFQ